MRMTNCTIYLKHLHEGKNTLQVPCQDDTIVRDFKRYLAEGKQEMIRDYSLIGDLGVLVIDFREVSAILTN